MLETCLKADLPDSFDALIRALDERAALDADVVHLMEALPALARAQRYGDVRGTDVGALTQVAAAFVLRICAALPQVVSGLDGDGANDLRRHVDDVQRSVSLLSSDTRERWLHTLRGLVDRPDVHGLLVGRMVRLLRDGGRIDDAPVRLARALSVGVPAAQKAAWVDGFFSDGAVLLIHDRELLDLLDDWVAGLSEQEFVDVLPLVRRTFGAFAPAERRAIADRVRTHRAPRPTVADEDVDESRAAAAEATVALILGVEP
jgi:hypothetical protein